MNKSVSAKRRMQQKAARNSPLVQKEERAQEAAFAAMSDGYALPFSDLPWRDWQKRFFANVATAPPAPRHVDVWNWFERLRPGVKPPAKIAIWPRGGAKSSTVEMGVAFVGARNTRRFALYICETQDQVEEHIKNIGALFEQMGVERAVGKYGASKGWKAQQLRTANGFSVAGVALEKAARGIRLGKFRPDLIIIDDIDGSEDTKATVKKKIRTLTKSLLPAGSSDAAVIFVQNKIHRDSIAAMLTDGRADFLLDREPIIEEPAIQGLEVKREVKDDGTSFWKIVKGLATWAGQSIATCQKQIAEWGLSAFLNEAQHDVDIAEGGLWNLDRDLKPFRIFADSLEEFGKEGLPRLHKIVVAVDPSGGKEGDEVGLVVAGVGRIGKALHAYVLESHALQCSPDEMATAALDLYDAWGADELVVEVNFGGEMAESTFKAAGLEKSRRIPPITMVRVSRGKLIRAKPVHLLYDRGQVQHREDVGAAAGSTHHALEQQQCKWQPGMDSPGALDAAVIALSRLFDLAEMVREVKAAVAYAPSRLLKPIGARKAGAGATGTRSTAAETGARSRPGAGPGVGPGARPQAGRSGGPSARATSESSAAKGASAEPAAPQPSPSESSSPAPSPSPAKRGSLWSGGK